MIRRSFAVICLIVDPPFGITDEPWEPEDVEGFNREWSKRWSGCGADFVAIFWCQARLWEGRQWFDESLKGLRVPADAHLARQQPVRSEEPHWTRSRRGIRSSFIARRVRAGRSSREDKTWTMRAPQHRLPRRRRPPDRLQRAKTSSSTRARSRSAMRWLINAFSEPANWSALCSAGWLRAGWQRSNSDAGIGGSSSRAEYRKIAEGRIAAYKDQPQQDDQDEEEILRAAAEIRQRRVAERLKEIQERRQQSRPVRIKKRGGPVLHGDCLDLIPTLEDESVSLVVTSPPYAQQRAGHYEGIPEEDYPDFTVQWMTALAPKMTPDGSVFLVIRPHVRDGVLSDYVLRTRLALREAGWHECEELIWLKPDAPPLGSKLRPRRAWESDPLVQPVSPALRRSEGVWQGVRPAWLQRGNQVRRGRRQREDRLAPVR